MPNRRVRSVPRRRIRSYRPHSPIGSRTQLTTGWVSSKVERCQSSHKSTQSQPEPWHRWSQQNEQLSEAWNSRVSDQTWIFVPVFLLPRRRPLVGMCRSAALWSRRSCCRKFRLAGVGTANSRCSVTSGACLWHILFLVYVSRRRHDIFAVSITAYALVDDCLPHSAFGLAGAFAGASNCGPKPSRSFRVASPDSESPPDPVYLPQ
jgi:hypothetical protein